MNLAELGEIAKAYEDDYERQPLSGRNIAAAGLGATGAGGGTFAHGAYSNLKASKKASSGVSPKGFKRMGYGAALVPVGLATAAGGAAVGARNMQRNRAMRQAQEEYEAQQS